MRVCGCASCSGACPEHRTAQRAMSQCPADTSTHESNWLASVTSSNSPPSPSSRHEPAHRAPASPSTRSFRRTVSGCAPSRECTPARPAGTARRVTASARTQYARTRGTLRHLATPHRSARVAAGKGRGVGGARHPRRGARACRCAQRARRRPRRNGSRAGPPRSRSARQTTPRASAAPQAPARLPSPAASAGSRRAARGGARRGSTRAARGSAREGAHRYAPRCTAGTWVAARPPAAAAARCQARRRRGGAVGRGA